MVDCGHNATTKWYPGDHLRALGVTYLDMLVVTNYDQDHVSGFINLSTQVTIGNIVRNTSVSPQGIVNLKSEDGIASSAMTAFVNAISGQYHPPGAKAALQFPGIEWTVHLNAYPKFEDENNLSLVLRLKIGSATFLFPGDLEAAGWKRLLTDDPWFAELVRDTSVLVASHHGRENGVCEELFDTYRCQPNIVVISDDYRQYDTQNTSNYYYSKSVGIENFRGQGNRRVLTTRSDGEIIFRWGDAGCFVS